VRRSIQCISLIETIASLSIRAMNHFYNGTPSYSVGHLDAAIEHLEQVLSLEGANSLFSQTYWRARVVQALATPGLAPCQYSRLQRLLARIAEA
jgi:hypothetical protein